MISTFYVSEYDIFHENAFYKDIYTFWRIFKYI